MAATEARRKNPPPAVRRRIGYPDPHPDPDPDGPHPTRRSVAVRLAEEVSAQHCLAGIAIAYRVFACCSRCGPCADLASPLSQPPGAAGSSDEGSLQRLRAAFRRTLGLTDAAEEAYWGYAALGIGAAALVVLAYVFRRRKR